MHSQHWAVLCFRISFPVVDFVVPSRHLASFLAFKTHHSLSFDEMWWSTAVMFVEFGISILNLGGKGESKGGQKFLAKYVETTPGACP